MKLFQQLLVAPAALGLMATGGIGYWAVDNSQRGQKAKGGGCQQQLLDKLHD